MATKSFLKNINIKKQNQAKKLADALEYAEKHTGKDVIMSRSVTEARGDKAKEILKHCGEISL